MNRVVLSGRLAGPPKIAYTPCGITVAVLRLLVPRNGHGGLKDPRKEAVVDEIDCIAFREPAVELGTWGERDCRVNLEGRLRLDTYQDECGRRVRGPRVYVDHVYPVDPILDPPLTTRPRSGDPTLIVANERPALPPKAA